MLIKMKKQFFNSDKVLKMNFATSEKNGKSYLVIELDTVRPQNKDFIEVENEAEFDKIIYEIQNQLIK